MLFIEINLQFVNLLSKLFLQVMHAVGEFLDHLEDLINIEAYLFGYLFTGLSRMISYFLSWILGLLGVLYENLVRLFSLILKLLLQSVHLVGKLIQLALVKWTKFLFMQLAVFFNGCC